MASVAVAATSQRRAGRLTMGLPCGRRTPRGKVRWYLLSVPAGAEEATCEKLRRIVPRDVLDDVFAMRQERWFKRGGVWFTSEVLKYKGFLFAVTRDVAGLDKTLRRLTFPVEIVGGQGHAWMPLAEEAQRWYAAAMDERHVIRSSTAVIVDGELHVEQGPLMGQESRMSGIDRHRRRCLVQVCDADGGFVERMPLDIPFKS